MRKIEKKKKNKIIGKIIKIIFYAIAVFILSISITIMYKANKYPDKVPDIFGYKPMIVLSGSMETSIYTGDLVFVKVIDVNLLKEKDIIAFRNEEDKVTTHRIIEIVEVNGQTYFKTKGDNNNVEDANLVEKNDVEGIYVTRIPGLGNFLIFMQQPIGLAVVLLLILVVGLICLQITNKINKNKFSKEEEQDRKEFEEFKRRKQQEEEHQD